MYVDESGFEPSAVREHGYAPAGERVHGLRPGARRPRTSLLAARFAGGRPVEAPMLFGGTCNAAVFNRWLEDQLAPMLGPEHVVVMDNAAFHKSGRTRETIRKAGARLLFLPPYSPDLNPIENSFAMLKKRRRYNPDMTLEEIINAFG